MSILKEGYNRITSYLKEIKQQNEALAKRKAAYGALLEYIISTPEDLTHTHFRDRKQYPIKIVSSKIELLKGDLELFTEDSQKHLMQSSDVRVRMALLYPNDDLYPGGIMLNFYDLNDSKVNLPYSEQYQRALEPNGHIYSLVSIKERGYIQQTNPLNPDIYRAVANAINEGRVS